MAVVTVLHVDVGLMMGGKAMATATWGAEALATSHWRLLDELGDKNIALAIGTAQGSATVAMITAGGILAGLAEDPTALGFHPVYLALAIGCGSKPFPWMNDSGFWLIGRTCGLTERETLLSSSTMISLMGCAGMVVVCILAKRFPLLPPS